MPKVSDSHIAARRREILDAAWRCFGRVGFHGTTMRDICDESGLSPGAVYQYFDGKEAIIKAVGELGRQSGAERIAADRTDEPVESLSESLMRFLECLEDPESLSSLRVDVQLCAEALGNADLRSVVKENLEHLITLFGRLVKRGQQLGTIDESLDPEASARLFVAIFQGLEIQKTIDPSIDTQGTAEATASLLAGTFLRTPAGSPQTESAETTSD